MRKLVHTAVFVATGSIIAIACARERPPSEEPTTPEASAQPPFVQVVEPNPLPPAPALSPEIEVDEEAMSGCTSAADCVVLELGCCDRCDGGYRISVNRMHAEQATRVHAQECSSANPCEQLNCDTTHRATCDAGRCARIEERPLGEAGTSVTLIHNTFEPR